MRQYFDDVKLGIVAGLLLGAVFCVFPLVGFLFKGSQLFDTYPTSLPMVLSVYLLTGGTAGLVVGIALPLAKSIVGAAGVGFLSAGLLWFLIGWSMNPTGQVVAILKPSVVLGAVFGVPLGAGVWYQVRRHGQTGKW